MKNKNKLNESLKILNSFAPDDYSDDGSDPTNCVTNEPSLFSKRGKIVISQKFLIELGKDGLKELFSVFYPIYVTNNPLDFINEYWGYSEYFKSIPMEVHAPQYFFKFMLVNNSYKLYEIVDNDGYTCYNNE